METAWGRGGRRADLESFGRSLPQRRIHTLDERFLKHPQEPWSNVPLVKWFWLCNTHSNRPKSNKISGHASAIPIPGLLVSVSILPLSDIYEKNGLSRAARTRDGLDVVIRVIVIGNEGHDHLKILRTIATGENSLFSNNHALPMFAEFQFEDITFGIFPKVGADGGDMTRAYDDWTKNSVGDIIEMLMQMLEVSFTFSRLLSLS